MSKYVAEYKYVGKFKNINFDWESDGLLYPEKKEEEVTQAWCMSAYDMDTDEVITFRCDSGDKWWEDAIDLLTNAYLHTGHNIYGYDYWLVHHLFGVEFNIRPDMFNGNTDKSILDTFLLSQIAYPDRKPTSAFNEAAGKVVKIGRHSVESYAVQFGENKVWIQNWKSFDESIIHRCEKDVALQVRIFKYLMDTMGIDWREYGKN